MRPVATFIPVLTEPNKMAAVTLTFPWKSALQAALRFYCVLTCRDAQVW